MYPLISSARMKQKMMNILSFDSIATQWMMNGEGRTFRNQITLKTQKYCEKFLQDTELFEALNANAPAIVPT